MKLSLLSRDLLPSLDEIYQVVAQDEESKRAGRMMEERSGGVSFAIQTVSRPRQHMELRDSSTICSTCGRTGHLAAIFERLVTDFGRVIVHVLSFHILNRES